MQHLLIGMNKAQKALAKREDGRAGNVKFKRTQDLPFHHRNLTRFMTRKKKLAT